MTKTLSIAEQRRQARGLLKDRLQVSADLAEEICRPMTNDLVRLLLAETAHNRTDPAAGHDDEREESGGDFNDIIDIPELLEEPPELNDHVALDTWVLVTLTDPIARSFDDKVRVRGISLDPASGQTYRFWDEFNTNISVALARFRRLRVAAGLDPSVPVRRGELVGKKVLVRYETRSNGKTMPQDYGRQDPAYKLNEG